jgi:hypothetical protein
MDNKPIISNVPTIKAINQYSITYSRSFLKIVDEFVKGEYVFMDFEEEKLFVLFNEENYQKFKKTYNPSIKLEYVGNNRRVILARTHADDEEMISLLDSYHDTRNKLEVAKEFITEEAVKKRKENVIKQKMIDEERRMALENNQPTTRSEIIINSLVMTNMVDVIKQYIILSELRFAENPDLEENLKNNFARFIFICLLNERSVGRFTVKIAPTYELLENC